MFSDIGLGYIVLSSFIFTFVLGMAVERIRANKKKEPREFTMIWDKSDPENPAFHVYTRGTIKPGKNQEAVDVREIWH